MQYFMIGICSKQIKRFTIVLLLLGLITGCNDKPDIDRSADLQLTAFPNPATTQIFIYAPNPNKQALTLQVFDPAGTMFVNQNALDGKAIDLRITLDDKPKGSYQAVLISGGSSVQQKFLKL
ncbi:hypothetical protein GCM10023189_30230 [Nibrella saemangeumensis]|uniref:Secretion system C-terminal sorting domain-containing protein n=1 Tax=Nibrella saemangeumensis TaxID=1084526 RepID=A0ABP8N1C6_9BACT